MKQIKLLEEIVHPKGNIPKNAILNYNDGIYEYKNETGITIFSASQALVDSGYFKFEIL